jgi:DNA-binding MarR family transcriptional regulator
MRPLPYVVPDSSRFLNVSILLLTINILGKSQQGKVLLNNERLLIFMYLVKNPITLAQLLTRLGSTQVDLTPEDVLSVSSLSVNVDSLFDHHWIKGLLKHLASLDFLSANYRKADGFVYSLTEKGQQAASALVGNHFEKVRRLLHALEPAKTQSTSSLNKILNDIFRR